jgi:hypothetical protein
MERLRSAPKAHEAWGSTPHMRTPCGHRRYNPGFPGTTERTKRHLINTSLTSVGNILVFHPLIPVRSIPDFSPRGILTHDRYITCPGL